MTGVPEAAIGMDEPIEGANRDLCKDTIGVIDEVSGEKFRW